MNKYKTFEELKEELGNKFDVFMYGANMNLLEQLEAYENMRKEAIEYIHDKLDRFDCNGNLSISMQITYCEEDLLNILNKVEDND